MSRKPSIEQLLEKYEQGQCTEEERVLLEAWYQSLDKELPESAIEDALTARLKAQSWERISAAIHAEKSQPKQTAVFYLKKIAAAAVVIGLVFLAGYLFISKQKAHTYISLKTSKGEFIHAMLPDHSMVWLSGGSFLRYRRDFNSHRDIFLEEGEAYFEVEHNEAVPFVVHTPSGISTKVLGTKFSVQSFAALADARVKVTSGKVQVQDAAHTFGILTKNEEIRINKISKAYAIAKRDASEVDGLKQGRISLNDVSFDELALSLENSFKTPVILSSNALAQCRISISYTLNDNVEKILDDIALIYKINIRKDERGITISGKGCSEKS